MNFENEHVIDGMIYSNEIDKWVTEGINYHKNQHLQSIKSTVIMEDGTITN